MYSILSDDDFFEKINPNEELKKFYELIDDENLINNFFNDLELKDARNSNYTRYVNINILKFKNLPAEYNSIVNEIEKLYQTIDLERILKTSPEETIEIEGILDLIYKYINDLETLLNSSLNKLEKLNNEKQLKLKQIDYSQIPKEILKVYLNKYNDIVLFNATMEDNVFDNYKRQLKRKEYICELYKLINLEMDIESPNEDIILKLNKEISDEIANIYGKIQYLEDLMIENSSYKDEFVLFNNYIKGLLAYDDEKYSDVRKVHDLLCNDLQIKSMIYYYEECFSSEREKKLKEETFIYNKFGIKNIINSLDYVSANYMNELTEEEKILVNELYNKINKNNYNIDEIYNRFKVLINNIWKRSISDVYSYNKKDNYCFICTNNQFIDEKYQAILITNKILERVNKYEDYQIGFICNYNDNILYITENEDIMTEEYNDMSDLKTPKQLEQEFLNFKVCNRIALNGYKTKVTGVYFINDGDISKYKKAVELSNQYKLPLVILKKDN